MIRATISDGGGLDAILDHLRRLQDPDLSPLAERIAEIVAADVRDRLASGTTAGGAEFKPLASSTVRQHGGSTKLGGSLPGNVQVAINLQADRVEIAVGWNGARAEHARFFSNGTGRMPGRDLTGVSTGAAGQIRAAAADFLRSLAGAH